MKRMVYVWGLVWVLQLLVARPGVYGQVLINANPADLTDSRSFLINPATISYHSAQLALGIKILHMGFMDDSRYGFRYQYGGISYPGLYRGNIGLAITGQAMNNPLYNQTLFGLALSQVFFDRISFGARVNFFNRSYDPASFGGTEYQEDPIFRNGYSRNTLSYSAGALLLLLPNLTMGIAFDNINKPNISFADDPSAILPFAANVGLKYDYKSFGFSTFLDYQKDRITTNFFVEVLVLDRAKFKVGYGAEAFKIETQLNLDRGVSINYHMDYPSNDLSKVSYGSHEMGIIYNLDWVMKSGFSVNSLVNTLKISRNSRTIIVDADVNEEELKRINDKDLDPNVLINYKYPVNEEYSDKLNEVETETISSTNLTNRYKESIDQVSSLIAERKDAPVEIIVPEGTEDRAITIKNRLTQDWRIPANKVKIISPKNDMVSDSITQDYSNNSVMNEIIAKRKERENQQLEFTEEFLDSISSDFNIFYIEQKYVKRPIKSWQLIIEDKKGKPVKTFAGWKVIPEEISWDWLDENFDFVKDGIYFYYLRWQSANDQYIRTASKILKVQTIPQNRNINMTYKTKEAELKQSKKRIVKYQFELKRPISKKTIN